MSKDQKTNIVICFDGTGNTPTGNTTNIVRIFRISKEAGNKTYYDAGVGTRLHPGELKFARFWFGRTIRSATGHDIIGNILDAYEYIINNFTEGTKLFFFGFSRGAYTARLLASIVHQIGILPAGHRNLIPYAVNIALAGMEGEADAFSANLGLYKPNIEFLGLFDSVKSALFSIDAGWSPIQIKVPFSWYNDSVRHVRHAMAIDERRAFFPVNRWAEDHTRVGTTGQGRTVLQVWFPGDHCDVGGGHTRDGLDLSVSPLAWMVREAKACGLTLADLPAQQKQLAADYCQLSLLSAHDKLNGRWKLAELIPTFSANDDDEPRLRIPNLGRGRIIPANKAKVFVHSSVRERMRTGKNHKGGPYRPLFMPEPEKIIWID